MDVWFYFRICSSWIRGTIKQGERLLQSGSAFSGAPDAGQTLEEFRAWAEQAQNWRRDSLFEEHFFVIALNRVFEWLEAGLAGRVPVSPEFMTAANEFKSSFPSRILLPDPAYPNKQPKPFSAPEAVRDMKEHEIDYLGYGKDPGWYQPSHLQPVDPALPSDMVCDASSTIVTDVGIHGGSGKREGEGCCLK
jgi:hypothetical protein